MHPVRPALPLSHADPGAALRPDVPGGAARQELFTAAQVPLAPTLERPGPVQIGTGWMVGEFDWNKGVSPTVLFAEYTGEEGRSRDFSSSRHRHYGPPGMDMAVVGRATERIGTGYLVLGNPASCGSSGRRSVQPFGT